MFDKIIKEMYKCPSCGENTFHLTNELTRAECDSCGVWLNYKKIPFMNDMMNLIESVRDAFSFRPNAKDLNIKRIDNEKI